MDPIDPANLVPDVQYRIHSNNLHHRRPESDSLGTFLRRDGIFSIFGNVNNPHGQGGRMILPRGWTSKIITENFTFYPSRSKELTTVDGIIEKKTQKFIGLGFGGKKCKKSRRLKKIRNYKKSKRS